MTGAYWSVTQAECKQAAMMLSSAVAITNYFTHHVLHSKCPDNLKINSNQPHSVISCKINKKIKKHVCDKAASAAKGNVSSLKLAFKSIQTAA